MTHPTRPAPATRRSALPLAFLVFFVDGYDLFVLGTVGPSLLHHPDWDVSPGTLGTLGSLTAAGMPVGSLLAGWAADRWGHRAPMAASVAWVSVCMLLAGLAPGLGLFGAARFGTGIGIGALAPVVGAYVAGAAPKGRRALHLAVAMGAIGVGGTGCALLGRLLLPETPFQRLFLIGALPLLTVPLIWRAVPARAETAGAGPGRVPVGELFGPARRRGTLLFCAASFMSLALLFSTTAWLPTVMLRSGYDLKSSLEFSIAFTIGASLGVMGLALVADRGHLKAVTLGCFVLAACALFALSTPQERGLLLVMSAVAGLGSLGGQNMLIACMSAFFPPRLRGTALGVCLGVGRAGAIIGPTYVAFATDLSSSHKAGFYAFMIPAVLGAALVALLPRRMGPAPAAPSGGAGGGAPPVP
ncbi:MFS transporter [Streptomyces sp. URMC 129]|uniref:MFS transporter n=1 Tax=Streptomyces sp. URMC 129 TaxID=3423407 RepID=UPI003F1D0C61